VSLPLPGNYRVIAFLKAHPFEAAAPRNGSALHQPPRLRAKRAKPAIDASILLSRWRKRLTPAQTAIC